MIKTIYFNYSHNEKVNKRHIQRRIVRKSYAYLAYNRTTYNTTAAYLRWWVRRCRWLETPQVRRCRRSSSEQNLNGLTSYLGRNRHKFQRSKLSTKLCSLISVSSTEMDSDDSSCRRFASVELTIALVIIGFVVCHSLSFVKPLSPRFCPNGEPLNDICEPVESSVNSQLLRARISAEQYYCIQ